MIRTACKLGISRAAWLLSVLAVICMAFPSVAQASPERKVDQWLSYYTSRSEVPFSRIAAFMEQNPHWPGRRTMQLEAERVLDESVPVATRLKWFEEHKPMTERAMDIYARTLMIAGRADQVRQELREWWENADLDREQQQSFFRTYGDYLDRDSHSRRLDTLLYRGSGENARAIAKLLGNGYPQLAEARLILRSEKPGSTQALRAIPTHLQNDAGLAYERLRWRRKNDFDTGAIALLAKAPGVDDMHSPRAWWLERHIMARRLIKERKYTQAYQIVSAHRQKEGVPFAQAEWLAGFLALRFMDDPWKAFKHFETLYNGVATPISKSRGAYWAGRASQAMRHQDVARKWYVEAARHDTTFYGQLAKTALGQNEGFINPPKPMLVSMLKISKDNQELASAAKILTRQGYRDEAELFLIAMRNNAGSYQDLSVMAQLASTLDYRPIAISAAQRTQQTYGQILPDFAYPILTRDVQNIRDVEWALVHALIRQESRFDKQAISPAGARGLMQVMPATAKSVARQNGWKHRKSWLTAKPSHNIQIGTRYIRDMLDRFDNNYAMALAAYNAGPNRVDRWIEEFGDPRKAEIDMLDWIELIPIYETRNYVQRVLEAVYVYRGRLKDIQPQPNVPIHVSLHEG